MTREEAMLYLAELERRSLTAERGKALLSDWWGMDADDEDFHALPESLRQEIETTDEPAGDSLDERYVPLLLIALRSEFFGVTNSYLDTRISAAEGSRVRIEGKAEPMERCPCCFHRALPEREKRDICPVCFWEDDGSYDPRRHSKCNEMSLGEARAGVAKFGVVDARFRDAVAKDARERYDYDGGDSDGGDDGDDGGDDGDDGGGEGA